MAEQRHLLPGLELLQICLLDIEGGDVCLKYYSDTPEMNNAHFKKGGG